MFYDNSILSGTKMHTGMETYNTLFYDNSILSGTKIAVTQRRPLRKFYDNSILSGTKITAETSYHKSSFTITQFFQVLKSVLRLLKSSTVLR